MNINAYSLLNKLCRTCMEEESTTFDGELSFKSLYSELNTLVHTFAKSKLTIMDLLKETNPKLSIHNEDLLPKIICDNCLKKLVEIYEFQAKCISIEEQLHALRREIVAENSSDPLTNNNLEQSFSELLKIEMEDSFATQKLIINVDEDSKSLSANNTILKSTQTFIVDHEQVSSEDPKDVKQNAEGTTLLVKICSQESSLPERDTSSDKNTQKLKSESKNIKRSSLDRSYGNRLKSNKGSKIYQCRKLSRLSNSEDESSDYVGFVLESEKPDVIKKAQQEDTERNAIDAENGLLVPLYQTPAEPNSRENLVEKLNLNNAFACDDCGRNLKTRKSLKRHKSIHLRQLDSKESPKVKHKCEYCQKVFHQSSSLKDHLRIHTGEEPYLCAECGKAFKSLSNMKQHFLRHGTDRPYECPHCPKKFPCLSDLASHKAVHGKTKSHVCDMCGAGFVKPYLLKKHKMYHTGEKNHKCDYCDMRFVLADQCRRHMRTHTGEKPYKCKYCVRAFAQSNDLIKHLRGHLGDNVYKCDMCPKGFRLQGDLRSHFNTHKNDDHETKLKNLQALKEDELRIQMRFGLMAETTE